MLTKLWKGRPHRQEPCQRPATRPGRPVQRFSQNRNTGVPCKTSRSSGFERTRNQSRSRHRSPECISDTRCRRIHRPGRTRFSAGGDQAEARLHSNRLDVGVKANTNHGIGRAANLWSVHYPWAQVYQEVLFCCVSFFPTRRTGSLTEFGGFGLRQREAASALRSV